MPFCLTRAYLPGQALWEFYPWRYAVAGEKIGYFPGGNRGLRDVVVAYQPNDVLYGKALAEGRIALWNAAGFCGYPVYASAQSATFYPLKLAICGLLDAEIAHNLFLYVIFSHPAS